MSRTIAYDIRSARELNQHIVRHMLKIPQIGPFTAPPDPLEGTPVGMSYVTMRVSVNAGPPPGYIAGQGYFIPKSVADVWILRDYATGELSRRYDDTELSLIHQGVEVVTLP